MVIYRSVFTSVFLSHEAYKLIAVVDPNFFLIINTVILHVLSLFHFNYYSPYFTQLEDLMYSVRKEKKSSHFSLIYKNIVKDKKKKDLF